MLHKSQNIQYVTFNTKYVLHFSNLLIHILFNEIIFHAFFRMLFQSLILQIMDRNCKMIRRFGCSPAVFIFYLWTQLKGEHCQSPVTIRGSENFLRLEATGAFHGLFGWNCVLRIFFFIRNYKKMAVFEKNSNQYFVFFWKHFIIVSCLSSVAK